MERGMFLFSLGSMRSQYPNAVLYVTVYDKPLDNPTKFVARLFMIDSGEPKPTNVYFTADTLEEIQSSIPTNYFAWMVRHPSDDLNIVGTWI